MGNPKGAGSSVARSLITTVLTVSHGFIDNIMTESGIISTGGVNSSGNHFIVFVCVWACTCVYFYYIDGQIRKKDCDVLPVFTFSRCYCFCLGCWLRDKVMIFQSIHLLLSL